MKQFTISDVRRDCPLAVKVEESLNIYATSQERLRRVREAVGEGYPLDLLFLACIGYWNEADSFDERNEHAVIASRRIAEHLGDFPERFEGRRYTSRRGEQVMMTAFHLTHGMHRALQLYLFRVIIESWKTEKLSLYAWYTGNN